MITSCAPIPFILSNRPSPSLSRLPSIPKAGNLFGTTRIDQPALFALPPLRPYTRTSFGVFASLPGQNGQFFPSPGMTLSRRKSMGRFPRSVEMITQRPVIGSLRNSGNSASYPLVREYKRPEEERLFYQFLAYSDGFRCAYLASVDKTPLCATGRPATGRDFR